MDGEIGDRRDPNIVGNRQLCPLEILGSHSNNRRRMAVQSNLPAENVSRSLELLLPNPMADDCNQSRAVQSIVGFSETASLRNLHVETLKIICRHVRTEDCGRPRFRGKGDSLRPIANQRTHSFTLDGELQILDVRVKRLEACGSNSEHYEVLCVNARSRPADEGMDHRE